MNRLLLPGIALVALAAGWAAAGETKKTEPVRIEKRLLGRWSFDEPAGATARDSSGNGCHATFERLADIERMPGISGEAIQFPSRHALRVSNGLQLGMLDRLSLSVWTMPGEALYHRLTAVDFK
jgi:hypothetical protein